MAIKNYQIILIIRQLPVDCNNAKSDPVFLKHGREIKVKCIPTFPWKIPLHPATSALTTRVENGVADMTPWITGHPASQQNPPVPYSLHVPLFPGFLSNITTHELDIGFPSCSSHLIRDYPNPVGSYFVP